jgi:hypothetical protein
MAEILFSILIFALVAVALGIGVLRGRGAIQGSCGGLNRIPGVESDCGGMCRRPCRKRRAGAANTD